MRADQGHDGPPSSPAQGRRGDGAAALDGRLAKALGALALGRGTLVAQRQRPWASITFTGAQHELTFRFDGTAAIEAGERLIAEAAEHEFTIPHQLVADVAVVQVNHTLLPEPSLTVRLDVLTIEEG
jgi:hypothetical protein